MPNKQQKHHNIFISYRRSDTRADAGRLYDRLSKHFTDDDIFMDIDDIEPGQDFQSVLGRTLASCDVLLVLIGPSWLDLRNKDNLARIHDDSDFVRLEIATALNRNLPVIPVLVNRAKMPTQDQLPTDIQSLANYQAIELSDTRFHDDVDELIQALSRIISIDRPLPGTFHAVKWTASMAVLILAIGFWFWLGYSDGRLLEGEAPALPSSANPEPHNTSALRDQAMIVSEDDILEMLQSRNFFEASRNPQGRGFVGTLEPAKLGGGDRVVIDGTNSLMWQRSGLGRQLTFSSAGDRIRNMNQRLFAGQADWRMPTLEEAASLFIATPQQGVHMEAKLGAKDTPILWTSDSAGQNAIWVAYVYQGKLALESKQFNAWLRAVRTID